MNKCDICNVENDNVVAGRWIFYCEKHKEIDIQKTWDNELSYDLKNGNFDYISNDSDLQDILLNG